MTDKEQIMIDGCNVGGCENYRPKDRFTCYPYICNCHQKPDCHYKQLARKTQEYELLVRTNKIHVDTLDQLNNKYIDLEQECEKYKKLATDFKDVNKQLGYKYLTIKQECEELKKRATIAEDNFACEVQARLYHQNEWLKFSKECEELLKENQQLRNSLSDSLMFKFTGQENETNRYRKALEEVEKEIRDFQCDNCEDYHCETCDMKDILNIINKAKGENKNE